MNERSDIYYYPEKSGFSPVGEIDTLGGYEFNILAVWKRNEDGTLLWGTDSGCSCYSPFEYEGVSALKPIYSAAEFAKESRAWLRDQYDVRVHVKDQLESLIRKVRGEFKTA